VTDIGKGPGMAGAGLLRNNGKLGGALTSLTLEAIQDTIADLFARVSEGYCRLPALLMILTAGLSSTYQPITVFKPSSAELSEETCLLSSRTTCGTTAETNKAIYVMLCKHGISHPALNIYSKTRSSSSSSLLPF
jgi:hypothetical protein